MKAFLKSFIYAFHGIIAATKTQRNFRIHIIMMIYVTSFSFFYNLSNIEYMILILTFAMVVSLELVNTALENVVDLCSPEYNKLAKTGKDCAAGAVLIAAIGAVIIGIFIFADIDTIKMILNFYCNNYIALAGLIISVAVSVLFICCPFAKMKGKNNEYKN